MILILIKCHAYVNGMFDVKFIVVSCWGLGGPMFDVKFIVVSCWGLEGNRETRHYVRVS